MYLFELDLATFPISDFLNHITHLYNTIIRKQKSSEKYSCEYNLFNIQLYTKASTLILYNITNYMPYLKF